MERGQATIEWLGAVALVALVLAAAAGVAGGEAIASSVVRGMHRALCLVSGGACDLDRRPCVVEGNATEDEAYVNLGIARVGTTGLILREHRADGSVLVTYVDDVHAGVELGFGGSSWASFAGREMLAGSAARAALLASLGRGEVWRFDSAADADTAMAYLGEGRQPELGRRVMRIERDGVHVDVGGQGEQAGVAGAFALGGDRVKGTIVDDETGRRTVVLERDDSAEALIRRRRHVVTGAAASGERLAITFDRDGEPVELTVAQTGDYGGRADLPDIAQSVADALLGADGAEHRRWVVEQRLDLTDPLNRAAAADLVSTLGRPLPAALLARTSGALRERLAQAGVTEARTYAVATDRSGIAVQGGSGVILGGGLTDETDDQRLIGARVLGPDGVWRTNPACAVS